MKDNAYTVIYSLGLGVVCASLLTAASIIADPYKKQNALAAEQRNVLGVLGVPFDQKAKAGQLTEIFEKNVRVAEHDGEKVYEYLGAEGSALQAVAVPFSGPGLWGPVKGFLALESDMVTVRSISFYEQEETPGLGGEIGSEWFQGQFKGKSIVDVSGRWGLRVVRGKAAASNEVDGITGATMTCDKVNAMLDKTVKKIIEEQNNNVK